MLGLLASAGFFALGVFQVKRLAWKEALLARVDRHVHAAPVPAPVPDQWPLISRESHEYQRIHVHGSFRHDLALKVRASTALGAGYWVMTPLRTDQGHWLLVNRGFIPLDVKWPSADSREKGAVRESLTGLLRMTEPEGTLLQANAPASNRWYSRDVRAMAAQQGLTGAVAPFFLDAAAQPHQDPLAWPRPGLTVLHFNNNHLSYALTWFSLAAMTLAAMVYLLVSKRPSRHDTA
jgi:surfeit locus 1 family protein